MRTKRSLTRLLIASAALLCFLAVLWPRAKGQAASLTITPASCPAAQAGQFYYCQLTATGGTPPYKWTLPPLATFEANYPGLQYQSTGENNSILLIWGVPQEPNDGGAILPLPPSGIAQTEN